MSPSTHRQTTLQRAPSRRPGTSGASAETFVGCLRYPTGHGDRTVIVQCHSTGDGFTVHLPAFNEAANYLRDAVVTLTSVSADPPGTPAPISGHSHVVADDDIDRSSAAVLEQWPGDIPAHYFKIVPESDRGAAEGDGAGAPPRTSGTPSPCEPRGGRDE